MGESQLSRSDQQALFYPTLSDTRENFGFWKVPRLRPFALVITTCSCRCTQRCLRCVVLWQLGLIGRCRSSFKYLANGKIFFGGGRGNISIEVKCVFSFSVQCQPAVRHGKYCHEAPLDCVRLQPISNPADFSQQSVQRYPSCSIRTDGRTGPNYQPLFAML
jgi:hypothetical protein